ncbi:hypothetical protein AFLA_009596 [Aspergillus flavus NRRL3357]|nr:hypothetical protein AFLA_009596 [Aspergillus flavus NRRL3357]
MESPNVNQESNQVGSGCMPRLPETNNYAPLESMLMDGGANCLYRQLILSIFIIQNDRRCQYREYVSRLFTFTSKYSVRGELVTDEDFQWAEAVVKLLGNEYGAGGGHSSENNYVERSERPGIFRKYGNHKETRALTTIKQNLQSRGEKSKVLLGPENILRKPIFLPVESKGV